MSFLKKPLDLEGLEDELQKSLNEDSQYVLENDAKLRAMEQGVPTYEHFRQLASKILKKIKKNKQLLILKNCNRLMNIKIIIFFYAGKSSSSTTYGPK